MLLLLLLAPICAVVLLYANLHQIYANWNSIANTWSGLLSGLALPQIACYNCFRNDECVQHNPRHTHTYTDYPCTGSGSGRQLGAPYNCSKSSRERQRERARLRQGVISGKSAQRVQPCSVRGPRATTTMSEQCTAQRVSLAKPRKKATKLLWWQWQWQCTGYGQGAAPAAAAAHITKRRQHYCHLNINRQRRQEAGGTSIWPTKLVHWAVGESWASSSNLRGKLASSGSFSSSAFDAPPACANVLCCCPQAICMPKALREILVAHC